MAKVDYSAVGRRKKAVARVRLVAGEGKVVINKRDIDNYFGLETLKMTVRQPLTLTSTTNFDVMVNVNGGGLTGQAGAIRHGISRALCKADPELRAALKKAGFLTRDPRMKERKKYGLKETKYRKLLAEKPEFAIRRSIVGMLPKGPLGRQMAKKLKVYAGPTHEHAAQNPEKFELV